MTEPESFPAVNMYLGHIDRAAQGVDRSRDGTPCAADRR